MTTDAIYARCWACDEIVKRMPGHRHGDGQVDSDETPVWLVAHADEVDDLDDLPTVQCGCTEH